MRLAIIVLEEVRLSHDRAREMDVAGGSERVQKAVQGLESWCKLALGQLPRPLRRPRTTQVSDLYRGLSDGSVPARFRSSRRAQRPLASLPCHQTSQAFVREELDGCHLGDVDRPPR